MRNKLIVAVAISCLSGLLWAPAARAADGVTYEVISDNVATANIEYFDGTTRKSMDEVPLPWRTSVTIANPRSLALDGAEIRADWRRSIAAPVWRPGKFVSVRIYIGKTLRCQNTLDVGNAACYGSTSFKS